MLATYSGTSNDKRRTPHGISANTIRRKKHFFFAIQLNAMRATKSVRRYQRGRLPPTPHKYLFYRSIEKLFPICFAFQQHLATPCHISYCAKNDKRKHEPFIARFDECLSILWLEEHPSLEAKPEHEKTQYFLEEQINAVGLCQMCPLNGVPHYHVNNQKTGRGIYIGFSWLSKNVVFHYYVLYVL